MNKTHQDGPIPQSGSMSSATTTISSSSAAILPNSIGSSSRSKTTSKSRRELPRLFYYMEMSQWDAALDRLRYSPTEAKIWATLRTKSMEGKVLGTKRLALHHACFKLRSASASAASPSSVEDPFVQVCRFILRLVKLHPEAAGQRESRHGCLPLHLAAFASCAPRPAEPPHHHKRTHSTPSTTTNSNHSSNHNRTTNTNNFTLARPSIISKRTASDATTATTDTVHTAHTNMSAVHAEELYAGNAMAAANESPLHGSSNSSSSNTTKLGSSPLFASNSSSSNNPVGNISVSMRASAVVISSKREEMAVHVLNALLDAYPKAIRVDSEGGRLPLHTACAGRATPRVISTLVTAYPSAARHRNKDGFLPLHLVAHWGVSHPDVAITLLKTYPDATVGRNRWERTPLEEALCMAGENGRPHQALLVRALRKHPSYWSRPPSELFRLRARTKYGSTIVDVDESLPSNDSTTLEEQMRHFDLEALMEGYVGVDGLVCVGGWMRCCVFLCEATTQRDELVCTIVAGLLVSPYFDSCLALCSLEGQGLATRPANGIMGRLRKGKKEDEKREEDCDLAVGIKLSTLIQNQKWTSVLARLEINPHEAEEELREMTRGGFYATTGMAPLHYACERKPPVEVVTALLELYPMAVMTRTMPGGSLPLHVACTWYASADVVDALLSADPGSSKVTDELGNVALHSACFSGAEMKVVESLLAADPNAVLSRNHQGSRPIDICKRLRHDNRRRVIALLTLKKEEVMAEHRRGKSSGNLSEVAGQAVELNAW